MIVVVAHFVGVGRCFVQYCRRHGSDLLGELLETGAFDLLDLFGLDVVVDVLVVAAHDEGADHADEADRHEPPDMPDGGEAEDEGERGDGKPAAVFFGMWIGW